MYVYASIAFMAGSLLHVSARMFGYRDLSLGLYISACINFQVYPHVYMHTDVQLYVHIYISACVDVGPYRVRAGRFGVSSMGRERVS